MIVEAVTYLAQGSIIEPHQRAVGHLVCEVTDDV
jgi:hypothetical protein